MLARRGVLPLPESLKEMACRQKGAAVTFADVLAAFRGPKVRVRFGLHGGSRRSSAGSQREPDKGGIPDDATAARAAITKELSVVGYVDSLVRFVVEACDGTIENARRLIQLAGGSSKQPSMTPAQPGTRTSEKPDNDDVPTAARVALAKELSVIGYDDALVRFIVGACDGTVENARQLLRLAGGSSKQFGTAPVPPDHEYIRRARVDLGLIVEVVDPGVIAGPPPRTNACQFLSCILAASRVLSPTAVVPDDALWQALQADVMTVRATHARSSRKHARQSPRSDALGVAADHLRGHVCSAMASPDGVARWLPSFALIAGDGNAPGGGGADAHDFHHHVTTMRTTAFADHQTFLRQQNSLVYNVGGQHSQASCLACNVFLFMFVL